MISSTSSSRTTAAADAASDAPQTDRPGTIIAVHLSYASRADERGRRPAAPSYFLKPSGSVATGEAEVERPAGTELLAFEGEIALIVGATTRRVRAEDAWDHIAAVTAADDWGLYDLRSADKGSNLRNKGRDGYTSLAAGRIDAATVSPDSLRLRTWKNGTLVQEDTSAAMIFALPRLVADLSQHLTLEPGDVILTGTPAGASVAEPGDTIEVEVDAPDAEGAPSSGRAVSHVVEGPGDFDPALGLVPAVDDRQREEAWGSREKAGLPTEDAAGAAPGTAPAALTPRLKEKLQRAPVAGLAQEMRRRGFDTVTLDGLQGDTPGATMVGTARTLRFVPLRPDLFSAHGGGHNAQKRAFDAVEADEVVVIEARGERGAGTLGDILALRAKARGAAGVVTDGCVRDAAAVGAVDLPVFSQGAHPAVLGRRHVPWDTDVTISCGGATVQPGDVIVGDDDGVIVIPPSLADEVVDAVLAKEDADAWVADRIAEGHPIDGLFPMNSAWRERFEADSAARRGDADG
ncbi:hypothetical protein GCM10027060_24330 [Nesterenkonia halophila]|uniref:fumarylacetoacetate hydrolase family protein n=1 Tax=Nesterenkonia halophila TaxID=302044 RepID=UPI001291F09C|nr:fumarylacetoacetate hydrolase family protein [Nesterenkonia halophila]